MKSKKFIIVKVGLWCKNCRKFFEYPPDGVVKGCFCMPPDYVDVVGVNAGDSVNYYEGSGRDRVGDEWTGQVEKKLN